MDEELTEEDGKDRKDRMGFDVFLEPPRHDQVIYVTESNLLYTYYIPIVLFEYYWRYDRYFFAIFSFLWFVIKVLTFWPHLWYNFGILGTKGVQKDCFKDFFNQSRNIGRSWIFKHFMHRGWFANSPNSWGW